MTFEKKKHAYDLNAILPAYKKISEAPNLEALAARAKTDNLPMSVVLRSEWFERYKSIDSSGSVYLCQNPALLLAQSLAQKLSEAPGHTGWAPPILRAQPKYVGDYSHLMKEAVREPNVIPDLPSLRAIPDLPYQDSDSLF